MQFYSIYILIAAIWATGNGILHDIFVIQQHKGGYDRPLMRLLLDGHILISCGVLLFVAWKAAPTNQPWVHYLVLLATGSLLVYCAMIFPFLKSIGTIAVNLGLLVMALIQLYKS